MNKYSRVLNIRYTNFVFQWLLMLLSITLFGLCVYIFSIYDPFICSFQYISALKYNTVYLYIGVDGISIFFLLLVTFVVPLCLVFI